MSSTHDTRSDGLSVLLLATWQIAVLLHRPLGTHQMLPKLLKELDDFRKAMTTENQKDVMFHSFEYLCPNRTEAWDAEYQSDRRAGAGAAASSSSSLRVHTELATSYDEEVCDIRYLGTTLGIGEGIGRMYPHFYFGVIPHRVGWREPLWWRVDGAKMIDRMLTGLGEILEEKTTFTKYLIQFPPSNVIHDPRPVVDHEGFVLYRKTDDKEEPYVVSKLKEKYYYWCHQSSPNPRVLQRLSALPSSATKVFPQVEQLHRFLVEVPSRLKKVGDRINTALMKMCPDGKPNTEHMIIKVLSPGAMKGLRNNIGKPEIQNRILINNLPCWDKFVETTFIPDFPRLMEDMTLQSNLRSVVMLILPWLPKSDERIEELCQMAHPTLMGLARLL